MAKKQEELKKEADEIDERKKEGGFIKSFFGGGKK